MLVLINQIPFYQAKEELYRVSNMFIVTKWYQYLFSLDSNQKSQYIGNHKRLNFLQKIIQVYIHECQ